ncbi:glycosyltransferase family 4 protein [Streptomyces sp. JJ66]|uniref:glycosyltransferase family 4 protein n=1 Tax=Streptomyces sp. JJ66 TaxID=2803843 RepID=UPI001C5962C4|nr:glycosyltransferase family 4 protein [Streptomyces sp. JJ66]MBW1600724.1 glycosyltransferase family 4 protein [Streptomyces sp. JJ66]
MTRVRVVHRGYVPARAGAEVMAQYLAESLRRRGHHVGLYCTGMDEESSRWMASAGVEVRELPAAAPPEDRPDVVHALDCVWPDYPQAALRLAREWQVPFVFTPASAPGVWRDRPAVLEVARAADAVFVLTETERAVFADAGVPPSALHLIGQGPRLSSTAPDGAAFRARHGVKGPMVLFVGRKMRSKGYELLLRSARTVWADHPETWFVFAGPEWDEDCAEVFAAHRDPRILDLGLVDEAEKADALAACDLLCLPSTVDVFPLVFVEAWASGKPVVSADFAGSEEVVRHGVDGLLCEPTPDAVAAAVGRLLADPAGAAAMGESGRARAGRELGWEAVTDTVEAVYASFTAQPPGPS